MTDSTSTTALYDSDIDNDQQAMALALQQAQRGLFTTTPNPRVGCVIVQGQRVIGAGFTQPPGGNHAEIEALHDAAARGHDVRGATVYVTLEPCSHFGRTPPCADALVRAGVTTVVAAMMDPNPLVAGQGLAKLQAANIAVRAGVLQDEAQEMNIGFFKRMRTGRPWVRLKSAASLDGKTALHNGKSQWITGAAARDDGHFWRARACAILTGIGTVKDDNPQLSVRAVATPRQPRRIVIDSKLRIDPQANILTGGGTWIFTAEHAHDKIAALEAQGAEVIVMPNANNKVDLPAVIAELGRRQLNEVHIEAGSKLGGSLIREACVDELLLYYAPSLLGDGRSMFELPALEDLSGKFTLRLQQVKQIGEDLRILARFS
ncbi:diaminohydroxyphosphoribosylaminopyrimidine deaminase/5-amino-6-(5-phosphoribosylamino)uracil reductase [Herbaspirillum sp. Sphag1AN]|uniref:bifunctional diaminohydroxyphosphoribosylaminopyrimidine deaminase/5-amino-6-(5-phosphoribosylamino)uracil reductase RibD n=1 Tax=unclassified Herbaspirillum TaxID=2624150 RepID=UPI001823B504|nr:MULTISPECIES: bifunctional diaminohydroxyphosphoribosylaminopyrimidine deaminase/5-amino-6-(5-phosphoribosylamino)uracil reductase RibD [unclassified Herbaspirillum]MBB3214359.1 diaminohydroxyphosphoribosylaminopyrimidine deaminase/5-amino-6-(5-phosphoribosylamino)uracil reductase [Herbaspirillum sp. Sphag1AN]MBB3247411.1 diaminohydroxyphosphoribosylaminopyrimidine deaminase/5-amino-6-(5-phosphoribosylamino)uracil reductase [Herbaspirillum sp. Sphag64]